jgi:formylglycine-generating enzyme required for sulfatase activity
MWRMLPVIALWVGGALPAPDAQPGPDARVTVQRPDVVWIPGGWFLRGSDEADILYAVDLCRERGGHPFACRPDAFVDEAPRERVWVSAFGIDRTEVTFAAWRRCVGANACAPTRINNGSEAARNRLAQPSHPVAGVTWDEARRYCEWVSGRLPTEAEWERAARGHDGRRFPWGNYYNARLANHGRPDGGVDGGDGFRWAAPVGSFPSAASPYGILDAAGNVWEWTADVYEPEAYMDGTRVDPAREGGGGFRVIRGGSWAQPPFRLRAADREAVPEGEAMPDVGFRCAYDR